MAKVNIQFDALESVVPSEDITRILREETGKFLSQDKDFRAKVLSAVEEAGAQLAHDVIIEEFRTELVELLRKEKSAVSTLKAEINKFVADLNYFKTAYASEYAIKRLDQLHKTLGGLNTL